ncbi:MAG TPA: site-specific DNA-methyltransferase [Polyangia bacterium]
MLDISREFELDVVVRMSVDEIRDAVGRSKRATLAKILPLLQRDTLKAICRELNLSDVGREKQEIIDRILGVDDEEEERPKKQGPVPAAAPPPGQSALPFKPATAPPTRPVEAPFAVTAPRPTAPAPAPAAAPPAALPAPPAPQVSVDGGEYAMSLEVQPRKPRLAWQGMYRHELAVEVPTQVVEIVRPGRAVDRGAQLAGIDTRQVTARDTSELPPNRLIWTNDNLVALETLLRERDPKTRDHRYRGKVDLIYIDPPFMVNSDFRADNAIDIELDEDAGVQATKEPSLVEILAYKDTWRQGLDSLLTMLKRRLVLLKELLAPTGSIYVHLDWHAVHYVKVLMDEVFGYENFQNEIVWKRSSAHSDTGQGAAHYGRVTDTILFYKSSVTDGFWEQQHAPYDPHYIVENYKRRDPDGRIFRIDNIQGPGGEAKGNPYYEFLGVSRYWRFSRERMQHLYEQGRIIQTSPGAVPQYKRYLDEMPGVPVQNLWADVSIINNRSAEALGYPTQKPVELLERIIRASCPPDGLVLDAFMGSGTTCEAAERLGRRWIGIDNGKYAIHLARKRLIQLHGQSRPAEPKYEYVECEHCKEASARQKPQRSPGAHQVRPFTVENMGVYQRAEAWQEFQTQRNLYRDEMIRIFGGEPMDHSPLLHGQKHGTWVHIGPLDAPVSVNQVWNISREAQRTSYKAVTILSADFDTLSGSEKDEIKQKTGVAVTIRVIPASAIDEVKRRLELRKAADEAHVSVESMAVPAFYAPLSIVLAPRVAGRVVRLKLERCEVDIESFLASQRPVLKPVTETMSAAARKKAQAELDKWEARQKELQKWLAKATTWQKFIDFWAVDWDYGRRVAPDGKPIFETDWQSFRVQRSKNNAEPLVFSAEFKYSDAGHYRIAARVTDVFGNDGIATVNVEVP